MKLVIEGRFHGLNEYIDAERTNRYKAAKMKREDELPVILAAKKQLRGFRPKRPVIMRYTWFEKDRRRDKDNISGFGRKVIQDALVKAGVLKNDGWAYIDGFSDNFKVDKNRPRVEVEITEQEGIELENKRKKGHGHVQQGEKRRRNRGKAEGASTDGIPVSAAEESADAGEAGTAIEV